MDKKKKVVKKKLLTMEEKKELAKKRKWAAKKKADKMLDFPRYPWERQPNESRQAFEAFSVYRDMGKDRTIRKTSEEMGKAWSMLSDWSAPKRHDWLRRVEAYERHLDSIVVREHELAVKNMARRHANNAVAAMAASMRTIVQYIESDKNPDPPKMKERDAIRLFDIAVKVERLARGEPDTIVKKNAEVDVDVKVKSIDERRAALKQIMEHPEGAKHLAAISQMIGTADADNEEG